LARKKSRKNRERLSRPEKVIRTAACSPQAAHQPFSDLGISSVLKVSVCLIVRNEEKHLDRCLKSVGSIADEIIIIDTGSEDGTVEIAKKYTDHVFSHPWQDSFSQARNHYFKYAKGEWILQIDADEELVSADIPVLQSAIENRELDAIMVQIVSKLRNGKSLAVHNVERIFRNNGAIRYEGRVHNRLVGIQNAKVFPIRLIHYGYDSGEEQARKKFERTVSLLKLDLAEDADNPLPHHYLGCSYLSQSMFAEALDESREAIRLADGRGEKNLVFLWSHYNAAIASYRLSNLEEAEGFGLQALSRYSKHIDSHYLLSLVYFDRKNWPLVIEHSTEYLRLLNLFHNSPESFENLVTNTLNEAWNIHVLVGLAYFEIEHPTKCNEHVEIAIKSAPEPFVVMRAVGIYFHNKGCHEPALKYLKKALSESPDDPVVKSIVNGIDLSTPVSGDNPTISCCMIVKNEEAFLDKCLSSIKPYVDEIVVVDTGSDDQTVEIAKRHTNRVFIHPWEGSFSKARNQALACASCDWIFQIDGDEELVEGSGERLREEVRNAGEADAIHVNIISTYSNGTKRARHNFERLFRNNGIIHYEGIVHNRVEGARSIKHSRIELMHYGYNVEEKKAHEKFLRTSELLKRQIEENPSDPMPHHYLGTSFLSRGMNTEAARESVTAIELAEKNNDPHPLYIWAHHNAAIAFFRMGDLDKAREFSLGGIQKCPEHLDSYYTLTMVAGERGQWRDVLSYGTKYLELLDFFEKNPDKAGLVINSTLNEGPSIRLLIGHAYHGLGEFSKMQDQYERAENEAHEKWLVWWNAGCFHLDRSSDLDLAQTHLNRALHLDSERQEIWYMLAKLNNKSRRYGEEKVCLQKLFEMGSREPVVLHRLTALCISCRELEMASQAVDALAQVEPSNSQALVNLASAYQAEGLIDKALAYFGRAIQADSATVPAWSALGELSLRLGQYEKARTFLNKALTLHQDQTMPLLQLCEAELCGGDLIRFIDLCDKIMIRLGLNREKTLASLGDVMAVLKDIHAALEDKTAAAQAMRLIGLLQDGSKRRDGAEPSHFSPCGNFCHNGSFPS
jgi:glycosyltransferase involved in cell wall biosynthesis/Tfp pilus assembly protein PilF